MPTLSNLYNETPNGAENEPLVFKTPDGKRFTISAWQFIQDSTGLSELVVELEPESKP